VLQSLTPEQRIAQLMVLRLTSYDFKTKTPIYYDSLVAAKVKQYNIGAVCLFQGHPVKQASIINNLQSLAQTPILVTIDAEWGVGMRLFDSVQALPRQMMLGAVQDETIVYQYGKLVAGQCKRLGIHVNYAPVVDVNNNPNNPVINERSFGEDKYKVAAYGIQYMKGMQDAGVMACAKHFPGHGDVAVDSHYDLPVINKTMAQLDSLELYPFKTIFAAGVASVMVAHLYIPTIDSQTNRATSISKKNVTDLMRSQLGYQGLTFTDALEMQGVKKFYPDGASSVQSIIAGNDMLCLPGDVDKAIANGQLSQAIIDYHCKRVLLAKYQYGASQKTMVNPDHITADLNEGIAGLRKKIAQNALTVLAKNNDALFAMQPDTGIAYIGIGSNGENEFAKRIKNELGATSFYFSYKDDAAAANNILQQAKAYKKIIVGIHGYSRTPANNFGLSPAAIELARQLQQQDNSISLVFGNPYAIKNFCNAANLVACYEDDAITQQVAADFLLGNINAKGRLPVTVCDAFKFGSGINTGFFLPPTIPSTVLPGTHQFAVVDSIANNAIVQGAAPGCVVMVVKDGRIAYHKAFGNLTYDGTAAATLQTVYDMASVTKICATTLAVMKLFEQGKLSLLKKLGDYLPETKGTNKENLVVEDVLLHQAGLLAYIPFYKETIDTTTGIPYPGLYRPQQTDSFSTPVAENLYLRTDWNDTMYQRILQSPLGPAGKYVYSDNDFIFLGKIVERITGMPLDAYVKKVFYKPMQLSSTGFNPLQYMPLQKIAPTEQEPVFRRQLVRGYVHDPGAAMFGGVAGHAGLFSNAYDMAMLLQLLLNKGNFNGKRYLQQATIDLFTAYHSNTSRRGLGFDKPEKDNFKRAEPYPCRSASAGAFGHTGFTGTAVWADPARQLIYIFLSNRVCPDGSNTKLLKLNIRPAIHEAVYKALAIAAD
jgi:beta-glucosidase-like glycosyl hydrolase/CubicO group peptidase (beta-lactamase class C family)